MRPTGTYHDHDRQRRHDEPGTVGDASSWARSDRRRVRFSAALAALADKTQSVEPGADHRPHTRRSHSLRVARIGRRLAVALGADPDLVTAAGLAHDIGHPPFGHNGERALDEVAGVCGGFEGNAQTLRLLTRLEPLAGLRPHGPGLNLTRATLDATCKYPWTRRPGERKYGAYPDDAATLAWIRDGQPAPRRSLEAQLMDWADDVANAVDDLADAVRATAIPATAHHNGPLLAQLAVEHFHADPDQAAGVDLRRLLPDVALHAAGAAAPAALTTWAATTTNRLIDTVVAGTRAVHGRRPLVRHEADLVIPARAAAEAAVLRAVTLHYVLREPRRRERWARQRELIAELADQLTRRAPDGLDPRFRRLWHTAAGDADKVRVIVDQIAALTERAAVERHRAGRGRR